MSVQLILSLPLLLGSISIFDLPVSGHVMGLGVYVNDNKDIVCIWGGPYTKDRSNVFLLLFFGSSCPLNMVQCLGYSKYATSICAVNKMNERTTG